MSLILNIDTALETAFVSIANDGVTIQETFNKEQKDHGAFLQPAIASLLKKANISINELDAVAVVNGPGSYTGLRVGMASAKGICYAIKKPLITVGSLPLLASQAIAENNILKNEIPLLFCPMIDARRLEVFTAIYNNDLQIVETPGALVLNEHCFVNFLLKNKILFFGNGDEKWAKICKSDNALHKSIIINTLYMSIFSYKLFCAKNFSDNAYAEPLYIKEFYNTVI